MNPDEIENMIAARLQDSYGMAKDLSRLAAHDIIDDLLAGHRIEVLPYLENAV